MVEARRIKGKVPISPEKHSFHWKQKNALEAKTGIYTLFRTSLASYVEELVVQQTLGVCTKFNSNIGVPIHVITYCRDSKLVVAPLLAWFEVRTRMEQNVKMWSRSCERTQKIDTCTASCFYEDRRKKMYPPPPPRHSFFPPFLYVFVSFAILFTTQEYTHQSPGGARWMRAEIQWAHYAVKSIVSHHGFPWVAFVLFKCLHGTAWGLEGRCMVQE